MSETNERSVASAGSGSRLPSHLIEPEWLEAATGWTFFGQSLDRLGRDDLMAVIGYLSYQLEQERKLNRSSVHMLKAASAVSE